MGMNTFSRFPLTSDVAVQEALLNSATSTSYTIVDGSATSLLTVKCSTGDMVGGAFIYQVRASDGTDFQSLTGLVTYAAVNKAGTLTLTITEVSGNQAKAVSSGTLTLAWTFVANTANTAGTVKLQPTGSLTETTYDVMMHVFPLHVAYGVSFI